MENLDLVRQVQSHRQNQQNDTSIVVAATVATVVGNVGPAVVSMLDSAANNAYPGSSAISKLSSIRCARGVVQIHIFALGCSRRQ